MLLDLNSHTKKADIEAKIIVSVAMHVFGQKRDQYQKLMIPIKTQLNHYDELHPARISSVALLVVMF